MANIIAALTVIGLMGALYYFVARLKRWRGSPM